MVYNIKEIIITVSALIVCILLIRRIFRGKIGSRFQYALWLLVVLRLMIPVSIPVHSPFDGISRYRLMEWDTDDMVEQLGKPIQVTVSSQDRLYHLLAEDSVGEKDGMAERSEEPVFFMAGHLRYSWLDVLGTIWTVGMVLVMSWILITNQIFGHRLKKERHVMELSEEAEAALRKKLPQKLLGIYGRTRIYTVEDLASPCLYGLPGRDAVYLTPDIADDTDKLCHVLCHELCHKRHGDSLWGILRELLVTVYWFHPLIWAAAVLSKRDCELACDEAALELLGEGERIAYGETLLSIITRKGRVSDLICTATTMTGSGESVRERIGLIAKKPKVLGAAAALAAVLAAVVFVCAFTRSAERVRAVAFDQEMDTVTGADMLIPLPESVREACGQVSEEENDDVIIYQISSGQEVGRFARMSLKDVLQLVDEGREVVPLGDYGDNYLLKAYLGLPADVTTHVYTPAPQDSGAAGGMLQHEDIFYSEDLEGVEGVPGTDSNTEAEHVYEPETGSNARAGHVYEPEAGSDAGTGQVYEPEAGSDAGVGDVYEPEADGGDAAYVYESGTDDNTDTAYVPTPEGNSPTQIPAPEETDSYTFPLPYKDGQSLSAEEYAQGDDAAYVSDDETDYLPNETITTISYPAKDVNVDELHPGCHVYIKADYDGIEDQYIDEIEMLNRELKMAAENVVILSLNGEIREELLDDLTENRTLSVGDNSKVGALVDALPVPSTLNYTGGFSLQTAEKPYSLRFEYEMTLDSMPQEDLDMMYFNAAMLFYAIGNVDEITMNIKYPAGSITPSSLRIYDRADMEEIFNGLLQTDYEDEQAFRAGLEELHTRVIEYLRSQERQNGQE